MTKETTKASSRLGTSFLIFFTDLKTPGTLRQLVSHINVLDSMRTLRVGNCSAMFQDRFEVTIMGLFDPDCVPISCWFRHCHIFLIYISDLSDMFSILRFEGIYCVALCRTLFLHFCIISLTSFRI